MVRLGAAAVLVLLGGSTPGHDRLGENRPAEPQAHKLLVAQSDPVGPCSPYHAEDGDISSELPGCARRRRPAPGSLADELQFRRGAPGADGTAWDSDPTASDEPPRRRRRQAPRHRSVTDGE